MVFSKEKAPKAPKVYRINDIETNGSQWWLYMGARIGKWTLSALSISSAGVGLYAKGVFDKSKELGSHVVNNVNEAAVYMAGGFSGAFAVGAIMSVLSEKLAKSSAGKMQATIQGTVEARLDGVRVLERTNTTRRTHREARETNQPDYSGIDIRADGTTPIINPNLFETQVPTTEIRRSELTADNQ